MRRREFIKLLGGAAAWPLTARCAATDDVTRRKLLAAEPGAQLPRTFSLRMAELGYVVGQNLTLDYIDLQGQADRYGAAMQQLVERKSDVLIAFGPEEALKAAIAATKTIPIVMAAIDFDPFALGYVTSLARPTGNITGIVLEQIELAAKRLQLVKDAFPAISKATVFWDRLSADQWYATRDNAAKFGFRSRRHRVARLPLRLRAGAGAGAADHRGFLFAMTSPFFARDREQIVQFSLLNRLPSMFVFREYVDQGGLMSYGPSRTVMSRRLADYVHRIARGAKSSELPIERPTIFEMIINLRTAKALGLEFSPAMLLRADVVIE